jgi:dipeptidyl aminopeptidase/acylaminoacyl peptidase
VEIATGQVVSTLFEDESYDIFGGRLLLHPLSYEPILVDYYTEELVQHWFDDALAARFEPANTALKGLHSSVQVISLDEAMNRAILLASGKGTTPSYYFFDAQSKDLKRLATTYADIPEVVDPEVVSYQASDGYPITAYVTRPDGKGPFPTIVFPHGGPNTRDYPSFDYWTQFFVSRGYAVIKPNFRGSIGYGAPHLKAGFLQWGLRMQDDVMDGLDWMVDQGIADPERVCVVGGSYGGYVALVAAFKTPERLRCAVSFAGVTDLFELKQRQLLFNLGVMRITRIQSGTAMKENSPYNQVEKIGVPLLIVHGNADRSVMIEQSRTLVERLDKAGKNYRYVEQENGDHYLSIQSHRIQLFEEMDRFLAEHLK